MLPQHKQLLNENRRQLVNALDLTDSLWKNLILESVCTEDQKNKIQLEKKREKQVEALLDHILQLQGDNVFDTFCRCLGSSEQQYIVDSILGGGITKPQTKFTNQDMSPCRKSTKENDEYQNNLLGFLGSMTVSCIAASASGGVKVGAAVGTGVTATSAAGSVTAGAAAGIGVAAASASGSVTAGAAAGIGVTATSAAGSVTAGAAAGIGAAATSASGSMTTCAAVGAGVTATATAANGTIATATAANGFVAAAATAKGAVATATGANGAVATTGVVSGAASAEVSAGIAAADAAAAGNGIVATALPGIGVAVITIVSVVAVAATFYFAYKLLWPSMTA